MTENTKKIEFLSIVIPVYNDYEVLDELNTRLQKVIPVMAKNYELILIDDGSGDKSWEKIKSLKLQNDYIVGIKLMRNFGQHSAITAGLDAAKGEIIVLMDSDLQDRPEDIPRLLDKLFQSGASMAIAKWCSRKDTWFKIAASRLFYKVTYRITKIRHEPNLGVFRVIKKELIDELAKYKEKTATTLSLLYWIGADYTTVELDRDARFAGKSGYSFFGMLELSLDRIFSFSMFPIRAAIVSGLIISCLSLMAGIFLIIRKIFGLVAPGWTSITVLILFLFGLNFIFLGIIGEYLGRIFLETKQRPKYIIKTVI